MLTRIMSGIALVLIFVPALYLGGWFLYGLCMLISIVGLFELLRVNKLEKSSMGIACYIAAGLYYLSILFDNSQYSVFILVLTFIGLMSVYVLTFPRYKAEDTMWAFFSVMYVVVMLSYIYTTRMFSDGIYIVWLIFVSSWGNDTFAYFTGVILGKHKMAPELSPKKSIEGAVGGIIGATVLGLIYGYIVSPRMSEVFLHPVITFGIASFIGAILSIVGDLAASAIKRNHNVKDYGNIIPGHGGILDRFDSVIFTAPVVYWAVLLLNNFYMI